MRRLGSILLMLLLCAAARAQYSTNFEAPLYVGNNAGVALPGQDAWINPIAGSPNYTVHTYVPNVYGFPQNPQGALQFAAGRCNGAGQTTQAEHPVNFNTGDAWTLTWDSAVKFNGVVPAPNPIAGLSLENLINSRSFTALATWVNPNAPANWNAGFLVFNAAGVAVPSPGLFPGPQWQNLAANRWYRHSVSLSFSQNRILEVSITDLTTMATARVVTNGWYLRGGSNPLLPIPTAVRFTTAGATAGNILAVDNFSTCSFRVTGFSPPQAQEGMTVLINGCGFGTRTEDLSVCCVQPGGNGIPLTVLQVTDTQITARMGPVQIGAPPGKIEVIRSSGVRGTFTPTIDDIIPEDPQGTLVWDRQLDPRRAQSPNDFIPLFSPPPPGTQTFFGSLGSNQVLLAVNTPAAGLQPNTTIRVVARMHHNGQMIGSDVEATSVRLRAGAGPLQAAPYLADRICDIVSRALENQGLHTSFVIQNTGPNSRQIFFTLLDASHVPVPLDFGIFDVQVIDPIRIDPFPIGPVTAFYHAGLTDLSGTAFVSPIDMTGNDGATISPNVPLSTALRVDTELISLNLIGSSFTTRSWGTLAGQPNQHLGTLSVRHNTPSFFDVFADFTDSGASTVRVDVYYNTVLKATTNTIFGNVAQVSSAGAGFPKVTGCGTRTNNGPDNHSLWIDFDIPCIINPSGGVPVIATQIRVYAGAGGSIVQNIQAFDLAGALDTPLDTGSIHVFSAVEGGICYANCDGSTTPPILNVGDFGCFLNLFAGGDVAANCDGSTVAPVLNVSDFGCFLNAFAAGCS